MYPENSIDELDNMQGYCTVIMGSQKLENIIILDRE